MQNLGNRMVTIMDLGDGSVHRRHYDQIHFQGQETEQDGANPENVDPDEHMTSEEGPSAPMTRQTTDVWVPLEQPARGIAAPILQARARNDITPPLVYNSLQLL